MSLFKRLIDFIYNVKHAERMKYVLPKATKIIKIDVSAKYALVCDGPITREEMGLVQEAWKRFINDPDRHIIIVSYNLRLEKIDETLAQEREANV